MRLKVATTVSMAAGLVLLAAWPFVMGPSPGAKAPQDELRLYAIRAMAYFSLLLLVFFATAVLAWLAVRQAREEYRSQSRENLKHLIESTLEDHGRKNP